MQHVIVLDTDDATLAAITALIRERGQGVAVLRATAAHSDTALNTDSLHKSGTSSSIASVNFGAMPANTRSNGAAEKPDLRACGNLFPSHSRVTLIFAGWRLEVASRELWTVRDALVALSRGEFELLFTFAKHPQRALTRHQIIDLMRGEARLSHPRSVDVYVSRLRQKLESDVRRPQIIQTVRNGYKFSAPVTIR